MQFFLIFSLTLTAIGPVGANLGWLSPFLGFLVFAAGVILAAFLFFPALFDFFRLGFRNAPKHVLIIGLAALGILGYSVKLIVENPVNDVSTMGANATGLAFSAKTYRIPLLANTNSPNPDYMFDKTLDPAKAMQVPLAYPDLKPLRFDENPESIYPKVREALNKLPSEWKIVLTDDQGKSVELEKYSKVFRFVDDVIVEVKQFGTYPIQSEVNIRSKSRYGKSDFGTNRQNIEILKFYLGELGPKIQNQ